MCRVCATQIPGRLPARRNHNRHFASQDLSRPKRWGCEWLLPWQLPQPKCMADGGAGQDSEKRLRLRIPDIGTACVQRFLAVDRSGCSCTNCFRPAALAPSQCGSKVRRKARKTCFCFHGVGFLGALKLGEIEHNGGKCVQNILASTAVAGGRVWSTV